jgi:hypothetical protein
MLKKLAAIIVTVALCMFLYNPLGPDVAGKFTASNIDQIQVKSNNLNLQTAAAGQSPQLIKPAREQAESDYPRTAGAFS